MKSVLDFRRRTERISMVTCYDATSAAIVEASMVDCILVGDSLAMTMHGFDSTLPATVDLMALHVAAVRRGAPTKFVVADLPFLAHRGSLDATYAAVRAVMTAGAQAVKIEGIDGSEDVIRHIVQSGVPVMGHLGLTPQSVHALGGFKVQATSEEAGEKLLAQALRVQAAGAFALVLECVPSPIAALVTEALEIPTIGIGAGASCSGQVLVFQDLLGLTQNFKPKFVRKYAEGFSFVQDALNRYHADVVGGAFPLAKESYAMPTTAPATAVAEPAATVAEPSEALYSSVAAGKTSAVVSAMTSTEPASGETPLSLHKEANA
jgi:3-methyl-2-oxobutanoate hydroxymethyltransferase